MQGICGTKDTIYEATIETSRNESYKYIGKCRTQFIERYSNLKKAFKHKNYMTDSELSKQVWIFLFIVNKLICQACKYRFSYLLDDKNYQGAWTLGVGVN